MAGTGDTVSTMFDELCSAAEEKSEVTVGQIVECLGHRGFGPFLTIPALIDISPLGGIPAVPTALAAIIILFAVQVVMGRRHMWLPEILKRRSVPARKLRNAIESMRPVARWLDRWFHERIPSIIGPLATRIAAIIVIILCLSVPPLELLPFASVVPMVVIALIGLAITVRDGVLMLISYVAAAIGLGVAAVSWFG